MGERVTVEGSVDAVIFQNEENGYTVLLLRVDGEDEPIIVVGCIPCAAAGEGMTVTGVWVNHPVHGPQLSAESVERRLPQEEEDIVSYLSSGILKGIGPATAQRLVERFGTDTLRVLEEEPERLKTIKGITAKKAVELSEAFRALTGLRQVMEFLARYDLPVYLAMAVQRTYGDNALQMLRDDPYILSRAQFGVDFAVADAIAISMGFGGDDPCRLRAAIEYELAHNAGNGHVCLPREKRLAATAQLVDVDTDMVETALDKLIDSFAVVEKPIANVRGCYLPRMYQTETFVAQRLLSMLRTPVEQLRQVDKTIDAIEKEQGVSYAPLQRQAVRMAAEGGVLLLTGGPGTGKTTSLRGIVALYRRMGLDVALLAPTGRAAKRLGEVTDCDAQTIHRALGMSYNEMTGQVAFKKNGSDPLEAHAVIVDEMSMVDLELMQALLEALRPGCRLVLVGDPDQLPSVGAGNVLGDLLRSTVVPAVSLTQVVRHHPQRPRRQSGPAAPAGQQPGGLLLPVPPLAGQAGADGGGAVPRPAAQKHERARRSDPGAVPHPKGRLRHGGPEPRLTGGTEPARRRKAAEAVGRRDVPGGRPGHADEEQLRCAVGKGRRHGGQRHLQRRRGRHPGHRQLRRADRPALRRPHRHLHRRPAVSAGHGLRHHRT